MKPKAASDSIASRLSLPGADVQAIATRVVGMPEGIDALFEGLGSKTTRVKYGSAKVLRMVSEQAPDLLYPWWVLSCACSKTTTPSCAGAPR
jgi:hypothetical protein